MFSVYSLLSQGLGGIQPVDVPGIENVRSPTSQFLSHLQFRLVLVLHCFEVSISLLRLTWRKLSKATLRIFGRRNRSWSSSNSTPTTRFSKQQRWHPRRRKIALSNSSESSDRLGPSQFHSLLRNVYFIEYLCSKTKIINQNASGAWA